MRCFEKIFTLSAEFLLSEPPFSLRLVPLEGFRDSINSDVSTA